jgi:hypothetical protein
MMKKWLLLTLLAMVGVVPLSAQIDAIQGHCTLGGTKALVSGLPSSNYQQGIVPGCTVSVYLTGTTTLATIFSNPSGTVLGNPFTAVQAGSPNPGYWIFYAANGQGYDVKLSGGNNNPSCTTAPNCYAVPLTYTDLKVGGSGGGGSGVTFFSAGNDPPLFNTTVTSPGTTPNLAFTPINQNASTLFGNFTGVSAQPFFAQYACAGQLLCNYDAGTNTWTLNVPSTSTLSVTSLDPIKVNGGNGPVSSGTAQISCDGCGVPNVLMSTGEDATHVFVPFTVCTPTTNNPSLSVYLYCDAKSGATALYRGGLFNHNASPSLAFSNAALPSWLPAGNVVSVKVVAYSDAWGGDGTTFSCAGSGSCTQWGPPPSDKLVTVNATGVTGSNIGSFTATATLNYSVYASGAPIPFTVIGAMTVQQVGLLVEFTGVTNPNTSVLNVAYPLTYFSDTNTLGVSENYPTDLVPILTSDLPAVSVEGRTYFVSDNTAISPGAACTGSGTPGSDYALCQAHGYGYVLLADFGSPLLGVNQVTAADTTLTVSPTTGHVVVGLNLASTNHWTARQYFSSDIELEGIHSGLRLNGNGGPLGDCVIGQGDGNTPIWGTCGGGGSGSVSGQAVGVVGLGGSATSITSQSHINENTGGVTTVTQPLAVSVAGGQGGTADLTEGTTATAAAGHDVLYADSSAHCIKQSLNGGSFACLGTGGSVSIGFSIASGVVSTPATPLILAPLTGAVSNCYFTTNTSDGVTALTFNIKFNGVNIISGTNATVAAGTVAGTVSTFTLTSGSVAITAAQKWEIDITSGSSSWSGIAQCF